MNTRLITRMDKAEFKVVVTEKILAKLTGEGEATAIKELIIAVMEELLKNKTALRLDKSLIWK